MYMISPPLQRPSPCWPGRRRVSLPGSRPAHDRLALLDVLAAADPGMSVGVERRPPAAAGRPHAPDRVVAEDLVARRGCRHAGAVDEPEHERPEVEMLIAGRDAGRDTGR